jgi:hypothetical protein
MRSGSGTLFAADRANPIPGNLMNRPLPSLLLFSALVLAGLALSAHPVAAQRRTDPGALGALGSEFRAAIERQRTPLYYRLLARTDGPQGILNRRPDMRLMGIDSRGMPRFYTVDNIEAARTVNTDDVWPGGSAGYALTGAGTLSGELGEWDGGGVRTTHVEFGGRVTQMDVPAGLLSHSTHVAGTLIAAGLNASARGMSYEGTLAAYDWNDDTVEMAAAAAGGMLVSNHSYGFAAGWLFNLDGSNNWFWLGDTTVSATEDFGFGYYGPDGAAYDQIAYDAPNYLIVKSAGNDRNNPAPAQPDSHYIFDPGLEDWVWSMTVRDPDGGGTGYDTVPWFGVAKNILTIGAVNDISAGWTNPAGVLMTTFSGWGPADDGRIKPDLVANGAGLFSTTSGSNGSYGSSSGTSMSTPNVAGSVNLMVRHYEATHADATPRAATMKAVVLHTANECGAANGPDYRHGWGLLNTSGAADVITADVSDRILERTLAESDTDEYELQHPGGDLRVTIVWTDPAGAPPAPALDPPAPMLVNDLDLRVEEIATMTTHLPWVLDPLNPANAAVTGDNVLDNVEQVFVPAAPAGTYRVTVGHKSTLASGTQDYSIVGSSDLGAPPVAGVPGTAPALRFGSILPNPFTAGTRIEFELPVRGAVDLAVFDAHGRRVRALDHAVFEAGPHALHWDGRGDRGERLSPGIYFLRAHALGRSAIRRLVRLD